MNLFVRLRGLFDKRKLDAEMFAEMQHHIEQQTELNVKAGMSVEEARFAALRQFGNVASIQERAREGWGWVCLEQFGQDMRFAARTLRRSPGFSAAVVVLFALGVGVSTAMFSVVHGVLLDPYPYAKAGEIWAPVVADLKSGQWVGLRVRDYLELSKLSCVSSVMTTAVGARLKVSGDPYPDVINAVRVSGTAFPFLNVSPVVGRAVIVVVVVVVVFAGRI